MTSPTLKIGYFGPGWHPRTSLQPTPVGSRCGACGEPITDGDRGQNVGDIGTDEHTSGVTAMHAECLLHARVGHLVGVCRCNGYGRTHANAKMAETLFLIQEAQSDQPGRTPPVGDTDTDD